MRRATDSTCALVLRWLFSFALVLALDPQARAQTATENTAWRLTYGLGESDTPDSDADGDGRTNQEELEDGTHPRGFYRKYLAEGASTAFFQTRLALLNPGTADVSALLRFETAEGKVIFHRLTVPAQSRRTVPAEDVLGPTPTEFATTVESDGLLVVDRLMTWGHGHGSHAEAGVPSPGRSWYLAEGATHSGFDLFYLLQNATDHVAHVKVRYLRPDGHSPIVKEYQVPPRSRYNIWVNTEAPDLASADISSHITSDQPILVERAMYLTTRERRFSAGHNSAGIAEPALKWFLAEGATGPYFDLFVLIANPSKEPASVTASFLLPSGETITKDYTVAPNSRFTVWVDEEQFPEGSGARRLADTAVSTTVTSTNGTPIVVERAMWWPGRSSTWQEAHNSAAIASTGTRWALAEGEVGGSNGAETYILIANTSPATGLARVSVFFENGETPLEKMISLPAESRVNVAVGVEFPATQGRRFGAVVESLGDAPAQVVVERAMYADAPGVPWASGSDALASPLAAPVLTDKPAASSGTMLRVYGSGFSPQTRVAIADRASPVTFISSTELLVSVPFGVTDGQPAPLAPGGSSINVDGVTLPLTILDLPPNPYAAGVLLNHVVEAQLSEWDDLTRGAAEALETLQATAQSPEAAELLASLARAIPAIRMLIESSIVALPSVLDAQQLALTERVMVSNGLSIPMPVSAAAATGVPRSSAGSVAPGVPAGDTFLRERQAFAQTSDRLGHLSTVFGAVALACPPCEVGALVAGVASLTADAVVAVVHGSVTRVDVKAAHDPIPVAGSTASASIRVEKSIGTSTFVSLFAAPIAQYVSRLSVFARTPGLSQRLVEAADYAEQALSALDRYVMTVPGGVALAPSLDLPVSVSYLTPTVMYYKLAFRPTGDIEWSSIPRRTSEEADFRLQPQFRTISESRVVGHEIFRVEQPRGSFLAHPTYLSFGAVQGSVAVPPQSVAFVTDPDVDPAAQWTASADRSWIQVPASGNFQPSGTPPAGGTNIAITVNPTGLGVGRHTGTVTISAPLDGSPQTIAIVLEVTPRTGYTGRAELTSVYRMRTGYSPECSATTTYALEVDLDVASRTATAAGTYKTQVLAGAPECTSSQGSVNWRFSVVIASSPRQVLAQHRLACCQLFTLRGTGDDSTIEGELKLEWDATIYEYSSVTVPITLRR